MRVLKAFVKKAINFVRPVRLSVRPQFIRIEQHGSHRTDLP
jgi:hypothetical protein